MMLEKSEYLNMMDKMPIPCIDLAMDFPQGLLWIKRDNHPYRGCWAMPGGRMFKYETMDESINRIAKKETGIDTSYVPKELVGLYSVVNSMTPELIRHDVTSLYYMDMEASAIMNRGVEIKPDKEQVQDFQFLKQKPSPIGELHEWEYRDLMRKIR